MDSLKSPQPSVNKSTHTDGLVKNPNPLLPATDDEGPPKKKGRKTPENKRIELDQKIIRIEIRIAQLEAKSFCERARWRAKRLDLPDKYPDFKTLGTNRVLVGDALSLDYFERTADSELHDRVRLALMSDRYTQVMDGLSQSLECSPEHILMLETYNGTRHEKKAYLSLFRFAFNPKAFEFLKLAGDAWFDKKRKSWLMIVNEESRDRLNRELYQYFEWVVDLATMTILKRVADGKLVGTEDPPAFKMLPFHIGGVDVSDVQEVLRNHREHDDIDRIYIYDGTSFVPVEGMGIFWTRAPFLLLRYSVSAGRPRYVSYSTLGDCVETVDFGKAPKLIARYHHACQMGGVMPLTLSPAEVLPEMEGQRETYRGPFQGADESIREFNGRIDGIDFAPIVTNYITLETQGMGADIRVDGPTAFAFPGGAMEYTQSIASFFGFPLDAYPIVFNPNINFWPGAPWSGTEFDVSTFLGIVVHELGHYLVMEIQDLPNHPKVMEPHGIAWAICNDLLYYVVFEDGGGVSDYCRYHLPDGSTCAVQEGCYHESIIGNMVIQALEMGVELLHEIGATRKIHKKDLLAVAATCIREVANRLT